jgi:hypothetical protein
MIRALALPRRPVFWLMLSLVGACMPPQEPEYTPPAATGGSSGQGGSGSGGKSGSGGSGGSASGGSQGSGGSASGGSPGSGGSQSNASSGGAGGSANTGGAGGMGTGGKPGTGGADGGAPLPNSEGTWANLELAISGCVFCHPGELAVAKNSDFSDPTKLHEVLLGMTTHVPAGCAYKTLVVPGKPEESLIYQKLQDKVPANCGSKMPMGKPSDPWVTAVIKNWIMAGAPSK